MYNKPTWRAAALVVVVQVVFLGFFVGAEGRRIVKRQDKDTLELVHVLFRHGDRTPDKHTIYPNDPYINETYYPVGHGQLTNAGKRKEYFLGKSLRKRYGKRLLANFTWDEVDARSTNYNRTKMSLHLVLASLFPAKGDQVWEKGIKWQPIPFNYWPLQDDHVIGDPYKNCPNYKKKYLEYMNSSTGRQSHIQHDDIFKITETHTGKMNTPKELAELYFTLTTEQENGFPHPNWAKPIYSRLKSLAILDYISSTATESLQRLSSGFFIKKLVEDTEAKLMGHDKTKIFLYSAHEYNIAFLLRFLGVYYPHIPPYGSHILIEIHNINGMIGVKLFYHDYEHGKPKPIRLPECGKFCPWSRFKSNYKKLIPDSTKECY